MTMRVAIVNPVWEPAARTLEETLQRFHTLTGWANAIAAAGAAVTVHQRFPSSSTTDHRGLRYAFVQDGGHPKASRRWSDAQALAASVREAEPDLVHVNGVIFPEWLRNLRHALPRGTRLVAQDHGGWAPSTASIWSQLRIRRGLSAADALLVSSPGHASIWRASYAVPSRVRIADVMEASTTMRLMPLRDASALTGLHGNPAVLSVGRLIESKDPLTTIEGFSLFLNTYPDAFLSLVYNEGTLQRPVQERIERDPRLAARVRLIGAVPSSQMAAYYSAADIFVSASRREGSGYAAIEAMACGATPILTDIPSFRVLTGNGRVGALWQPGQPQSLCDALVKVTAEPREALRTRVREQFDSALSWEVLGRRAVGIYREVCDR